MHVQKCSVACLWDALPPSLAGQRCTFNDPKSCLLDTLSSDKFHPTLTTLLQLFWRNTAKSWRAADSPEGALLKARPHIFSFGAYSASDVQTSSLSSSPPVTAAAQGCKTCESKLSIMDGFSVQRWRLCPCDKASRVCVMTEIRRGEEHQVALWGWAGFMAASQLRVQHITFNEVSVHISPLKWKVDLVSHVN